MLEHFDHLKKETSYSLPSYSFSLPCSSALGTTTFCLCRKTVLVAQSCLTLCDPMDCSPPGFSVLGSLQARMPEWFAISVSGGSSWPRDWTWVSCIAGRFSTVWLTRKAPSFSIKWVKSLSRVQFFVIPWTVAYQAPPSMGFSRPEYWSGLPFLSL